MSEQVRLVESLEEKSGLSKPNVLLRAGLSALALAYVTMCGVKTCALDRRLDELRPQFERSAEVMNDCNYKRNLIEHDSQYATYPCDRKIEQAEQKRIDDIVDRKKEIVENAVGCVNPGWYHGTHSDTSTPGSICYWPF